MKIAPPVIPPAVNLHRNFEEPLFLSREPWALRKISPFSWRTLRGDALLLLTLKI